MTLPGSEFNSRRRAGRRSEDSNGTENDPASFGILLKRPGAIKLFPAWISSLLPRLRKHKPDPESQLSTILRPKPVKGFSG